MRLGSLVPGYQAYKRRWGATWISLDSSQSYLLPTKTHSGQISWYQPYLPRTLGKLLLLLHTRHGARAAPRYAPVLTLPSHFGNPDRSCYSPFLHSLSRFSNMPGQRNKYGSTQKCRKLARTLVPGTW